MKTGNLTLAFLINALLGLLILICSVSVSSACTRSATTAEQNIRVDCCHLTIQQPQSAEQNQSLSCHHNNPEQLKAATPQLHASFNGILFLLQAQRQEKNLRQLQLQQNAFHPEPIQVCLRSSASLPALHAQIQLKNTILRH